MNGRELAGVDGLDDVQLVGRGGFGTVYRAEDRAHGRVVAVKVLHAPHFDEQQQRRFDRERQAMGVVGAHPHVVQVFSSGLTADGEPYLVMEYASGGSLSDRLNHSGALPPAEAADIVAKLAAGVAAAHDAGVLHRDIKPDNVLISHYGEPMLTDFGIASIVGGSHSTGHVSASVAYASPEQLNGEPAAPSMDIYGLGSLLFALVAGGPAFVAGADGVGPVMMRIFNDPVPDLRPQGVPDELCRVIERAMAKDPADRYPTAGALAEALAAVGAPNGAAAGVGPGGGAVGGAALTGPETVVAGWSGATDDGAADLGSANEWIRGASAGGHRRPTRFLAASAAAAVVVVAALAAWALFGRDEGETVADGDGSAEVQSFVADPAGEGSTTDPDDAGGDDGAGSSDADRSDGETDPGADDGGDGAVAPSGDDEQEAPRLEGFAVAVECPDSFVFGETTVCDIRTNEAVSGTWTLPGFVDGAVELENVPGSDAIFVEPTNPAYVGAWFTLTATVTSADGETVSSEHPFTVASTTATAGLIDELNAITAAAPITFESGSAEIRAGDEPTIAAVADALSGDPEVRIEVGGHTDATGDIGANQALSEARAEAVVEALVAVGVPADQLIAAGYGPTQPIAGNDTADGRARNRRIGFREVGDGGAITIACPTEFVIGLRTECAIMTANALDGSWSVAGFTDGPVPLAVVPGTNVIFLEPNNAEFAGANFSIDVEVTALDGSTATAEHPFSLVLEG